MCIIYCKEDYVRIKLTPLQLEAPIHSRNPNSSSFERDPFRRNPRLILERLAIAYGIDYQLREFKLGHKNFSCTAVIKDLLICVLAYGETEEEARKSMAYKVHQEYCERILHLKNDFCLND